MLDYPSCLEKLRSIHQEHLLSHWDVLTGEEQILLLKDIDHLNFVDLSKQIKILEKQIEVKHSYTPFQSYAFSGNADNYHLGKDQIRKGKVGCLVLAGGQGTRLGFEGPKGLYPISLFKNKSFFQLIAEKTLAAGKQADKALSVAIMTSPLNHQETVAYFEKNNFFGLSKEQVHFFSQDMLPFLNEQKKLFLSSPSTIAKGPNGNGLALQAFWKSGIGLEWKNLGIEYVNSILIDNPLADPFDAELIGFHASHRNAITLKCVEKKEAHERVGVIVKEDQHVKVVEYTELPKELSEAKDDQGHLIFRCANISLFCWSMDFIEEQMKASLPLHVCLKKSPCLENREPILAWKFEYFIFDLLLLTNRIHALLYPRSQTFAPLKDRLGPYNPKEVQKALLARDLEILSEITGQPMPSKKVELACDFYYPTPALRQSWYGRQDIIEGYVNP